MDKAKTANPESSESASFSSDSDDQNDVKISTSISKKVTLETKDLEGNKNADQVTLKSGKLLNVKVSPVKETSQESDQTKAAPPKFTKELRILKKKFKRMKNGIRKPEFPHAVRRSENSKHVKSFDQGEVQE